MKNFLYHIAVTVLLLIIACNSASSGTGAKGTGGTWTIKSVTYQAVACTGNMYGNAGTLSAQNQTTATSLSSFDLLICSFFKTLPVKSGTYKVVENARAANQVSFLADVDGMNGTGYISTGGKGNETVSVTVSGGKVSISGMGITMAVPAKPADITMLSVNITQLQ